MKLTSIAALAATAVFASTLVGAAGADGPRLSVDPTLHPQAAAAQDLVRKAFFKLEESAKVTGVDPTGHMAKALNLLVQANDEIAAATPGSLPPQ
jgi:hypothetical protein